MDIHLEENTFDPVALLSGNLQDLFIKNSEAEVAVDEPEIQDIQLKTIKDQWVSLKKEAQVKKEKRHGTVAFQREKVWLEVTREDTRSQIKKINSLICREECQLVQLRKNLEADQKCHDNYLCGNKRRAENALAGFQQAQGIELEVDVLNEALIEESKSTERDLEHIEGVLSHYTHCKDMVFKMSPVEWQETQQTPKGKETEKSPNSVEDYPALFTPTPEDFSKMMTELMQQNVSLIQNTAEVDDTLKELNQCIETTSAKTKEEEEKVDLQNVDLSKRVDVIKTSITKLKQRILLYDSLKSTNKDIMFNALGEKVSKTYSQCMGRSQHRLSTLEMVANIESRMCTLLTQLENIPDDFVKGIMKINHCEKRSLKAPPK
ncbi:cilia- and flagella-associated protein 100 [Eucyclogobius newberryi]|uniref:cilia- and flagella-associated protein 100 n=1 Tax=Eucyclogobius newberryi TaxID=166745 RepID=UPI003B5CBEDE